MTVKNGKPTDGRAKTQFKKGNPGRKKGSKNKLTTDMKQFYFDILNHTEMNGLEGAVAVFSKNDRNKIIFYQGGFKMLPSNVDVEHSGKVDSNLTIEVVDTK